MYYFEKARLGFPVFVKSNGIPMYVGNRRISKIQIVWWMPTNWFVLPTLFALAPFLLAFDWYVGRQQTTDDREGEEQCE